QQPECQLGDTLDRVRQAGPGGDRHPACGRGRSVDVWTDAPGLDDQAQVGESADRRRVEARALAVQDDDRRAAQTGHDVRLVGWLVVLHVDLDALAQLLEADDAG